MRWPEQGVLLLLVGLLWLAGGRQEAGRHHTGRWLFLPPDNNHTYSHISPLPHLATLTVYL